MGKLTTASQEFHPLSLYKSFKSWDPRWRLPILQSMAELDEISGVQSRFLPHFLLIISIDLARALAILWKPGSSQERKKKRLIYDM